MTHNPQVAQCYKQKKEATVSELPEGYWYTRATGEREWREPPRCDCGGAVELRALQSKDQVKEGEPFSELVCQACGKVVTRFLQPTAADIERGRELAEKYGW